MTNRLMLVALTLVALSLAAAPTRDNESSCDIALAPAATLLLPYFEVDLGDRAAADTRFTIVNVTNADRVAHVTLWTDRAYPVLGFNVPLTGYDMATISLFDVLTRGQLAERAKARGKYSLAGVDLSTCDVAALPDDFVRRMQSAFTTGRVDDVCSGVGSAHVRAIGYATIDVVGSCSTANVEQREYWTRDLRYDNVLTGDYEQLSGGDMQSEPLVHIRAIRDAAFPRTFYSRYQSADAPRLDARQPLPSRFVAHWIEGGAFHTDLKIWRESVVPADAPCSEFARNAGADAKDIVRFDEFEYGVPQVPCTLAATPNCPDPPGLNAASRTSIDDPLRYPQITNGNRSGWIMLSLDRPTEPAQAWVTTTMSAGALSVDITASALGNGCAPPTPPSDFSIGALPIAPANAKDDSCDITQLPAATLLLPHFRVDPRERTATTLFSITNTTREERIARVTLWTDLAVPILTFNVFLTGYDVQSIDLYDVLVRGTIGSGTSSSTRRGPRSVRNRNIELGGCESLPGPLPPELAQRAVLAFTEGRTQECDEVGLVHSLAEGYATIDVVNNCASIDPEEASYWTRDVAFDNVLTGDYQVIDHALGAADGAPLVHIRAVSREARGARTFYSRLSKGRDARQPLPSTFAARWNTQPGTGTLMEIWRDAVDADSCGDFDRSRRPFTEIVRFDDNENGLAEAAVSRQLPYDVPPTLSSSSRTHVLDASFYPQMTNGAQTGWMYFNLRDPGDAGATQAWIAVTQRTLSGSVTRRDAVALGNGCTPPVAESEVKRGTAVIGPAPKRNR